MGENKMETFQLAHEAREILKNRSGRLLHAKHLEALVEVFEISIGETVPTKAEIELYLSENEKLLTLSPDDARFYEAIENVKAFQRDYGL